ncbi:MAG: DUF2344 domain-containing protein, partial [bacterium]
GPQFEMKSYFSQRSISYRLYLTKLLSFRCLGHLDFMRMIEMSLRRSGLPLQQTSGYIPHLKISSAPALPLGVGAFESWVEFYTYKPLEELFPSISDLIMILRKSFPVGIKPLKIERAGKGFSAENSHYCSLWRLKIKRKSPRILGHFEENRDVITYDGNLRIDEIKQKLGESLQYHISNNGKEVFYFTLPEGSSPLKVLKIFTENYDDKSFTNSHWEIQDLSLVKHIVPETFNPPVFAIPKALI